MAVVRWNPWSDLFALHSQMDQLFSNLAEPSGRVTSGNGEEGWISLPVDIHQSEDAFTITASVPGFAPEDVEVTFDAGMLTIRGVHRQQLESTEGGWVRRERRTGSVHREIGLPAEVRAEEISASFDKGVLTITVPRAQKAQPKRIPVAVGQSVQAAALDAPVTGTEHS